MEVKGIQAKYGSDSVGLASPRRAVQRKKPIWCRAAPAPFGNNKRRYLRPASVISRPGLRRLAPRFGTSGPAPRISTFRRGTRRDVDHRGRQFPNRRASALALAAFGEEKEAGCGRGRQADLSSDPRRTDIRAPPRRVKAQHHLPCCGGPTDSRAQPPWPSDRSRKVSDVNEAFVR